MTGEAAFDVSSTCLAALRTQSFSDITLSVSAQSYQVRAEAPSDISRKPAPAVVAYARGASEGPAAAVALARSLLGLSDRVEGGSIRCPVVGPLGALFAAPQSVLLRRRLLYWQSEGACLCRANEPHHVAGPRYRYAQ